MSQIMIRYALVRFVAAHAAVNFGGGHLMARCSCTSAVALRSEVAMTWLDRCHLMIARAIAVIMFGCLLVAVLRD